MVDGWYSFHRSHAVDQVVRVRRAFGDRLSAPAHAVLGEVLHEANSRATNPAEERTDAALRLVVEKLEAANQRLRAVNGELIAAGCAAVRTGSPACGTGCGCRATWDRRPGRPVTRCRSP